MVSQPLERLVATIFGYRRGINRFYANLTSVRESKFLKGDAALSAAISESRSSVIFSPHSFIGG